MCQQLAFGLLAEMGATVAAYWLLAEMAFARALLQTMLKSAGKAAAAGLRAV